MEDYTFLFAALGIIEVVLLYAIVKTYEFSKKIDANVTKILKKLEENA